MRPSQSKASAPGLYALAAPLNLSVKPAEVTRDVLLSAMQGKILAASAVQVIYARAGSNAPVSPGA